MKLHLVYSMAVLAAGLTASAGAATYTWQVNGAGDFATPGNWSPALVLPLTAADILVVDGAVTAGAPRIDNLTTQSFSGLRVLNNANATISVADGTSATWTLTGGADVLQVGAGSTLTLTIPNPSANGIRLQLATGSTANIAGTINFTADAAGTNVAHRLLGTDAGSINFLNGSSFGFGARSTGWGFPFGAAADNTVANTVIFQAGSTAYQGGSSAGASEGTGSSLFGPAAPSQTTIFQPGSNLVNYGTLNPATGRVMGNYIGDNRAAAAAFIGGATVTTIENDLIIPPTTVSAASFGLTGGTAQPDFMIINGSYIVQPGGLHAETYTGTANFLRVRGNVSLQGSGVTINANTTRIHVLDGTANQSVALENNQFFNALVVDKASGVVNLTSDVRVRNSLTLTNGDIVTGANRLILAAAATLNAPGGKITGRVGRVVDAAATGATNIPLFAAGGQSIPVGIGITAAGTGTGVIDVETLAAPTQAIPGGATAINRAWSITADGVSGFTGTLTVSYLDADLNGAPEADLKLARWNGSSWDIFPATLIDTVGNTATLTGVTNFSEWTLMTEPATVSEWMQH